MGWTIPNSEHTELSAAFRRESDRDPTLMLAVLQAEHEASPDGILVVDQNRNIVSFNRRFVQMWEIPTALVAARQDPALLPFGAGKVVDPEGFAARVRYLYEHPEDSGVDEIALKDGRIFERHTSPTRHMGRYLGRVWFFRDVTAFVLSDRKSRESAAQFSALAEQQLLGVVIVRLDGKVCYVNSITCKMFGYARDEMVERLAMDFVATQSKDTVARYIGQIMSGTPNPDRFTASLLKKDGNTICCLLQGTLASYEGKPALFGVALDISEIEAAQESLQRLNRVLRTLSAGNAALVRADTEAELLQNMCRAVIEVGGYKYAWIGFARHDQAKTVEPVGWPLHGGDYVKALAITWADTGRGLGPTGTAIRTGRPRVISDIATDPTVTFWRDEALGRGYRSAGSFPLRDGDETFGAITLYAGDPDAFNVEEVKLLTELAGDLSYGIVSLRARAAQEDATQRLRRSLQSTVQAIASTLELRDPYTAGHQRAVAKLSMAIAREIGIPDGDIEGIYLAGIVHDIGKVQIPAEILAKPGALSKLERQLVQTHAQAGYDIIKGVEFPWPVADMILQHHERLDGSGYPNGLKADRILLGAKIIAVADVVEAMTAHRPYRAALGLDTALAEIEKGRGIKYYPPAVDACIDLFRSKGFKFESGAAS